MLDLFRNLNKMKRPVYTIGIVDDQPEELAMIVLYLERLKYLSIVFNETDPMKALSSIEETCPDILLLDMQMPGLDGLQLYQSLSHKPVLVICSGHTQYSYEASALGMVAYLPKWLAFDDFESAMIRAVSQVDLLYPVEDAMDSIMVRSTRGKGAKINIPKQDILHVEVLDKISTFHCTDFDREARITLDMVQTLLSEDQFIRTHKSHIVNVTKVTDYSHTHVFVHGYPHPVPIGRTYLISVLDRLHSDGSDESR